MSDHFSVRRQAAEKLLGEITWKNESQGECKCPGADLHTNAGDTANIFVDGCPTLHCFHQSCTERISEMNSHLRSAVAGVERNSTETHGATSERKQKSDKKDSSKQRLLMLARANLNRIVASHPMQDSDEWIDRSPIKLPQDGGANGWKLLLGQLPAEQRVWIGQQYDSGSPEHAVHFQKVQDWLALKHECPGPFICPANFKEGAFQRTEEQIIDKRFIIVESDTRNKAEVSSIFLWLSTHWHLFAIVDTAGKSLHGWFEKPQHMNPDTWTFDRIVMTGLECDPAMFRPAQPCRLPGWLREDVKPKRIQRLLYLDHLNFAIPADLSLNP